MLLLSCDDGELAIDTIDFDSITLVQSCDGVSASTANLLFKITGTEALILELPSGLLQNRVTTAAIRTELSATSATQLTYRIFTDAVSSSYFCATVPPISPTVTEEVAAQAGAVIISTTTEDSETYTHLIELSGISFITSDGSRITDLQIDDFGTVTTTVPDDDLPTSMIDIDDFETLETCGPVTATAANVLFNINGAQALILELPGELLSNEVTTMARQSDISATSATRLIFRAFTGVVSSDYFCDEIPPIAPTVTEEIIANAGRVRVSTTTTDSQTFSHLIELDSVSFINAFGNSIDLLETFEFGTLTTEME